MYNDLVQACRPTLRRDRY